MLIAQGKPAPKLAQLLLFVFSAFVWGSSQAHDLRFGYSWLQVNQDSLVGRIEIVAEELNEAMGLGAVSGEALTAEQKERLSTYMTERFSVGDEQGTYPLTFDSLELTNIEDLADYVVMHFSLAAPAEVPDELIIHYSAVMDVNPDHRGGFHLENNYKTGVVGNHTQIATIHAPGRETATVNLQGNTVFQQLLSFVKDGIIHLWIGLDHVLFLMTLLLTAVLVRSGSQWVPEDGLKQSIWNVVAVVTVFTVAHSITLALAMKGWISLPSRFVESVIALSVLVVVIDNFVSILGKSKWITVFVFGLFHGLGFASVMEELALDFTSKLVALIGFNVGVEIGQLAIVLVAFPVLYSLRNLNYVNLVLRPASAAIGLLAFWWLVTRAFDIDTSWTSF